jgi:flagellar protein FlbD
MIILTRLNGDKFALNCDLVERVDATPDTVVTLVDSTKYLVVEGLAEIVDLVRDFRASVLVRSQDLQLPQRGHNLRLVSPPGCGVSPQDPGRTVSPGEES